MKTHRHLPSALLVTVGAGLLLTGCTFPPLSPAQIDGSPTAEPVESSPEAEATSSATTPEASEAGEVVWLVPHSTEWTTTYDAEQDLYHSTLDGTGCDVMHSRTTGVARAGEEGHEPIDTVDRLLTTVAEQTGDTPVEEPTEPLSLMAESGETFDFETRLATFDSDGENRTVRAAAQWFDDTELLVSASCPSDEWEENGFLITMFLGVTSIDGV